jgi:hypothetical protein
MEQWIFVLEIVPTSYLKLCLFCARRILFFLKSPNISQLLGTKKPMKSSNNLKSLAFKMA